MVKQRKQREGRSFTERGRREKTTSPGEKKEEDRDSESEP